MKRLLPYLACFTDNHPLLFFLLHFPFLTGLIVHRQQIALHGAQLHPLKHIEDNNVMTGGVSLKGYRISYYLSIYLSTYLPRYLLFQQSIYENSQVSVGD